MTAHTSTLYEFLCGLISSRIIPEWRNHHIVMIDISQPPPSKLTPLPRFDFRRRFHGHHLDRAAFRFLVHRVEMKVLMPKSSTTSVPQSHNAVRVHVVGERFDKGDGHDVARDARDDEAPKTAILIIVMVKEGGRKRFLGENSLFHRLNPVSLAVIGVGSGLKAKSVVTSMSLDEIDLKCLQVVEL